MIIVLIIIIIISILSLYFISLLSDIYNYRSKIKERQKISFAQFFSLYSIAPEKWEVHGYFFKWDCPHVSYEEISESYDIYMESYWDLYKLKKFIKNLNTNKNNERLAKQRSNLIKCWQDDVNQYYETAVKEVNDMMK